MPVSGHPFKAFGSQKISLIKTLAGMVFTLGLLGAAAVYFVMYPSAADYEVSAAGPSRVYYLSAVHGAMIASQGSGTPEELALGQNMIPGVIYRCSEGSSALLRSPGVELEVFIEGGGRVNTGGAIDPAGLTLIQGSMEIRLSEEPIEPVVISLGRSFLRLNSVCHLLATHDQSQTQVRVYSGSALLDYHEKVIGISGGDLVTVSDNGQETVHDSFLSAPELQSPIAGGVLRLMGEGSQFFDFRWLPAADAERYRIEVARDVLFRQLIESKKVEDTKFTLVDPDGGRYYWRVRGISDNGTPGEASPARPFTVLSVSSQQFGSDTPPSLQITELSAQSNLISIRGQTEPGARVVVYLEAEGDLITEPVEIRVSPDGSFGGQFESNARGAIDVVTQAFYRPEVLVSVRRTVIVDF